MSMNPPKEETATSKCYEQLKLCDTKSKPYFGIYTTMVLMLMLMISGKRKLHWDEWMKTNVLLLFTSCKSCIIYCIFDKRSVNNTQPNINESWNINSNSTKINFIHFLAARNLTWSINVEIYTKKKGTETPRNCVKVQSTEKSRENDSIKCYWNVGNNDYCYTA